MEFGKRLKMLRNENHMSQKRLAEILRITDTMLRKYETGEIEPPLSLVIKVCDYFKCFAHRLTNKCVNRES